MNKKKKDHVEQNTSPDSHVDMILTGNGENSRDSSWKRDSVEYEVD